MYKITSIKVSGWRDETGGQAGWVWVISLLEGIVTGSNKSLLWNWGSQDEEGANCRAMVATEVIRADYE